MKLTKRLAKFICLLSISSIFGIYGCASSGIDYNAMATSEKGFNNHQQQERVIFMSLETMFPDRQARSLAEAAGKGKLSLMEDLVSKGADVNALGKQNATPLFWALRKGNIKGFTKLLEMGADPNIVFDGISVMHSAAKNHDNQFIKAALQYGGNANLVAGRLGETPIFHTISLEENGQRENRRLLLASGANINAATVDKSTTMSMGGQTPLLTAAVLGRYDIVYELLEAGADYKVKTDIGSDLAYMISRDSRVFIVGSQQERNLKKVISWLSAHNAPIK